MVESGALRATETAESRPGTARPGAPRGREKFGGIQAGRALAAILVVVHHAGAIIAEPRFYGVEPFGGVLVRLSVGVDFFFVLSGFIIAWVHWDDVGRPGCVAPYARNRVLRIYPPYWVVLLPLSALYALFPRAGLPSQHEPWNVAFSFLLAPYPEQPVLGVAWTLVHEVIFYAVFGLLIRLGRRAAWLLPGWAAAILGVQLAVDQSPFPFSTLFSEFNLEFLVGVATALWLRRHRTPAPGLVAGGACLAFVLALTAGGAIYAHSLLTRAVFGLASAALILGTVELERADRLRMPRPALLLGEASYAIYLIHLIALSATIHVLARLLGPTLPMVPLVLVLTVAGVAAGVGYHLAVERPLGRWLRARLAPGPRSRARSEARADRSRGTPAPEAAALPHPR